MAINIFESYLVILFFILSFVGWFNGIQSLRKTPDTRIEEGEMKDVRSRTRIEKFKDHQVLVDVNLKVNQGCRRYLGPSGSGKTTFLRRLNHLEKVIQAT